MPMDAGGNRADIVMDPYSTLGRMNLGRLHEMYMGASARETATAMRNMLGLSVIDKRLIKQTVLNTYSGNLPLFNNVYTYLMGFYKITNPMQYDHFTTKLSEDDRIEHITNVLIDGIYLYIPPDNKPECMDIVRSLEQHYPPIYGPVAYRGYSGETVTTHEPVRVAPLYMLLLEKIGDDWASVSSAKLQHFGILSPMTRSEKYAYPFRNSPVRTISETEGRIFVSYCGRETAAEMMDRNNSPATHRAAVLQLLEAPKPTNIYSLVDRNVIPFGNTKPLQIFRHTSMCAGWRTVYKKDS